MLQHVYYEDLLNTPFKEAGRNSKTGLDCYGFVIELTKRDGHPLKDLLRPEIPITQLQDTIAQLNVEEIKSYDAGEGDLVQCVFENNLHIAYLLDPFTVIHMTHQGVRITPTLALRKKKFFRIKEKQNG